MDTTAVKEPTDSLLPKKKLVFCKVCDYMPMVLNPSQEVEGQYVYYCPYCNKEYEITIDQLTQELIEILEGQ